MLVFVVRFVVVVFLDSDCVNCQIVEYHNANMHHYLGRLKMFHVNNKCGKQRARKCDTKTTWKRTFEHIGEQNELNTTTTITTATTSAKKWSKKEHTVNRRTATTIMSTVHIVYPQQPDITHSQIFGVYLSI